MPSAPNSLINASLFLKMQMIDTIAIETMIPNPTNASDDVNA